MENTISAQEIKRRGISAVDEALRDGPVHVIQRNRPRYVILSEDQYQKLSGHQQDARRLWEQLLHEPFTHDSSGRPGRELASELRKERGAWDPRK